MAVGVEKLKDTGYSGLVRPPMAGDGTAPELTLTAPAAFSLLDPAYCAKYGVDPAAMRDAMTHVAWKNHDERRAEPARPVPQGGVQGEDRRLAAGRRAARRLRLLRGLRRRRRARDRARRGRPPVHRQPDVREGAVAGRRPGQRPDRPRLRLHDLPRGVRQRRGRLRAGRRSPTRARRSRPGRGARLLHPDRARADGGPRVLRARRGLEATSLGRRLRPRRVACRSTPTAG